MKPLKWQLQIIFLVWAFLFIYAMSWLWGNPATPNGNPTTTTTACFLVGVPVTSCPATPGR